MSEHEFGIAHFTKVLAAQAEGIKRLRGLLREWFEASDPSIGGSPGSLLERTRAALSVAPRSSTVTAAEGKP